MKFNRQVLLISRGTVFGELSYPKRTPYILPEGSGRGAVHGQWRPGQRPHSRWHALTSLCPPLTWLSLQSSQSEGFHYLVSRRICFLKPLGVLCVHAPGFGSCFPPFIRSLCLGSAPAHQEPRNKGDLPSWPVQGHKHGSTSM